MRPTVSQLHLCVLWNGIHLFVSAYLIVGYKYVFRHWFDSEPCISSRYQPFVFERKNQTDCIYLKSSCNEEGQITYSNGSTTSDVKCKCDEKNGYTFVTPPRDNISCIPSEEDCSCYRKPNTAIGNNITAVIIT